MSFTWSFSALKEYVNCPRQYHEVKVLKRYEKKVTQQMTYGTEVHKACEDYVGQGRPLAKNYQHFQPILDSLLEIDGIHYPEYEMGLYRDGTACAFDDPERYVRGIVDLLIVDGETAYLVDYKTGSNKYPDPKQLKLMALMTFAHFPEVNKIKAGLLFVMHESFMDEEYTRDQIPKLWSYFESDLERLNHSYENDVWQANPTPLCGWCPVKSCEFHKER
jgi:hypothetical protein